MTEKDPLSQALDQQAAEQNQAAAAARAERAEQHAEKFDEYYGTFAASVESGGVLGQDHEGSWLPTKTVAGLFVAYASDSDKLGWQKTAAKRVHGHLISPLHGKLAEALKANDHEKADNIARERSDVMRSVLTDPEHHGLHAETLRQSFKDLEIGVDEFTASIRRMQVTDEGVAGTDEVFQVSLRDVPVSAVEKVVKQYLHEQFPGKDPQWYEIFENKCVNTLLNVLRTTVWRNDNTSEQNRENKAQHQSVRDSLALFMWDLTVNNNADAYLEIIMDGQTDKETEVTFPKLELRTPYRVEMQRGQLKKAEYNRLARTDYRERVIAGYDHEVMEALRQGYIAGDLEVQYDMAGRKPMILMTEEAHILMEQAGFNQEEILDIYGGVLADLLTEAVEAYDPLRGLRKEKRRIENKARKLNTEPDQARLNQINSDITHAERRLEKLDKAFVQAVGECIENPYAQKLMHKGKGKGVQMIEFIGADEDLTEEGVE